MDPFKVFHKKYKETNCGQYSLNEDTDLVDFTNLDQCESLVKQINYDLNENILNDLKYCKFKNQFKQLNDWKFYTLNDNQMPGLILVPNVLRSEYSKDLFNKLLYELPNEYLKLKSNLYLPIDNLDNVRESKLRWFTFGHHYDWTNKIYDKNDHHEIPLVLDNLLGCIKELLKLDLELEAGIVNYYTCKSSLNPHSDCREENLKPPLLSISLGEKAIFLIGLERDKGKVIPIILRDGDLMIMSGTSRLAYHSVVKIVCDDPKCKRKLIKRININVRQVY